MTPQPSPDHDTDHDTGRVAGRRADGGARRQEPGTAPSPDGAVPRRQLPPRAAGRQATEVTARPWGRWTAEATLLALAVAAVTGLTLGVLWLRLAPRVPLVSDGQAVMLANSEAEHAIAADGTFLFAGLAVGAVAGVLVFLARRGGGVPVVLGLAGGAVGGALLAWGMGDWFGPGDDIVARAREAGEGVVFDGPLELRARGVLMGLPFAALATHLLCVALWGPRDELPWEPDDAERQAEPGDRPDRAGQPGQADRPDPGERAGGEDRTGRAAGGRPRRGG